ncbi:hypothetical protein F4678DRAFT_464994 [Xylaria arbuscula]|nr:hypothetical protein F4678DRAFT_464994 [Xylaria arbuscula]
MSPSPRLVAIIGGTGAQGVPVVRDLLKSGDYSVRVLTRDTKSARFKELESYGPVEGLVGTFASEETLRATFRGAWGAWVNIDGFNCGEKTEMFWTIRVEAKQSHTPAKSKTDCIFEKKKRRTNISLHPSPQAWELAIEEGVKFYVHGNIDYAYKLSGFRPEFHCGHIDGKGRMGDWILAQDKDPIVRAHMRSALFSTGPYIEMTIGQNTPLSVTVEDGVAVWRLPLADAAIPFTALDDVGVYVKWLFDNAGGEADGINLELGIAHTTFKEYVKAFTAVTGHPARYENDDLHEHMELAFGGGGDPCGYNADLKDPATMTMKRNFTAWFNVFKNPAGDMGVMRRDYALLDRIYPQRMKTVEDWLRRENEKGLKQGLGSLWDRVQPGNLGHVLKVTEDQRQGIL